MQANVYYKEKGRGKTPIKGDSDLGVSIVCMQCISETKVESAIG